MNVLSVTTSLLGLLYIYNADSRLLLQTIERDICASMRYPADTQCQARPGSRAGIECAMIPDYCEVDSDCAVKNVGNCYGYYPGCVNNQYTPDLNAVQLQCQKMGMISVCGWSNPSGCLCENNKCQESHGTKLTLSAPVATRTNCDALPNEWTLVGTPKMCTVMRYICEPRFQSKFAMNYFIYNYYIIIQMLCVAQCYGLIIITLKILLTDNKIDNGIVNAYINDIHQALSNNSIDYSRDNDLKDILINLELKVNKLYPWEIPLMNRMCKYRNYIILRIFER